jgi:single stranded DNA-binding protein
LNGSQAASSCRGPRAAGRVRYTHPGAARLAFSVAVPVGKLGETEWVRVTLWDRLAEQFDNVLKKGDSVDVVGRLRLTIWRDVEGNDRPSLSVSASTIKILGAPGGRAPRVEGRAPRRPRRRRQYDQVTVESRETSQAMTVGAGRNMRAAIGLDDDAEDDDLPFGP